MPGVDDTAEGTVGGTSVSAAAEKQLGVSGAEFKISMHTCASAIWCFEYATAPFSSLMMASSARIGI